MPEQTTTWNVGDQVQLKSGGPVMTVDGSSQDSPTVRCVWFADGNLAKSMFHVDSLKAATPPG